MSLKKISIIGRGIINVYSLKIATWLSNKNEKPGGKVSIHITQFVAKLCHIFFL